MSATQAIAPRRWLSRWFGRPKTTESRTVCFFIPDKSRGWILDAACREIGQRLQVPTMFAGNYKSLPQASAYYFCHYHFYISALRINPWLANENCIVWFTHPKEHDFGDAPTMEALRTARVVTMCSTWRNMLIEKGLEPTKVQTIVGAADPSMFTSHSRGGGKIGFCTAYYERKMPDRILEIVQGLPEYECVLMGRNWSDYPRFKELSSLPNLEYREAAYDQYPAFYSELDVFVSASQLEGGPIPLLESMMSNVVPVASDTGFAPDVIRHGENGFLYSADEPHSARIVELVQQAKALRGDVRATVLHLNWDAYAEQHAKLFGV